MLKQNAQKNNTRGIGKLIAPFVAAAILLILATGLPYDALAQTETTTAKTGNFIGTFRGLYNSNSTLLEFYWSLTDQAKEDPPATCQITYTWAGGPLITGASHNTDVLQETFATTDIPKTATTKVYATLTCLKTVDTQEISQSNAVEINVGTGEKTVSSSTSDAPSCSLLKFNLGFCIKYAITEILYLIMIILATFLSVTGLLFDSVVAYALDGANYSSSLPVIQVGWSVIRDVANMFFIFIILAISIATILRLPNYGAKQLLARLIIMALLINFSLPIAGLVIDTGNMFANLFYNQIGTKDLSVTFASALGATQFFDPPEEVINNSFQYIIISTLLGSALILIAAFVLAAGAVLFLMRTVILWFLLILSPAAFLMMVLPKTREYSNKWWDALIKQSLFAPVFLFFFYVSMEAVKRGAIPGITDTTGKFNAISSALIAQGKTPEVSFIFSYIILAMMMLASLYAAQQLGAYGASGAIKWGTSAYQTFGGYVGRKTYGRVASAAVESKGVQKLAAASPLFGGAVLGTLKGAAETYEKEAERKAGLGMSLAKAERARYLSKANTHTARLMWKKMSEKERVEVGKQDEKLFGKMNWGLPEMDKEKTRIEYGKSLTPGAKLVFMQHEDNQDIIKPMFKQMSERERVEIAEKDKPFYDELIKTLSVEDREKTEKVYKEVEQRTMLKKSAVEDFADPRKARDLFAPMKPDTFFKVMRTGGEDADKLKRALNTLGDSADKVADEFIALGNEAMAKAVRGGPAAQLLGWTTPIAKSPATPEKPAAEPREIKPEEKGPTLLDEFGRPIQK